MSETLDIPDIQFCYKDEIIERETNYYSVTTYEIVQSAGGRFVYRVQRDGELLAEYPGGVATWNIERTMVKIIFDTSCIGFIYREADGNRMCVYNDHYHHNPVYTAKIRVDNPEQWDFFLEYFCTALGAYENRIIVPGTQEWKFRLLDYSPFYIIRMADGNSWDTAFADEAYPWYTTEIMLEAGYMVRCYYRDRGGNPIIAMKLDAPAVMSQLSLKLRIFTGKMDSSLCVCSALGDMTKINEALAGFSSRYGRVIR